MIDSYIFWFIIAAVLSMAHDINNAVNVVQETTHERKQES